MDMAGIGEKPMIRSGPNFLAVYTLEAAISSLTSSQLERTKPPMPRRGLYSAVLAGSSTIEAQASTGSLNWMRAARQSFIRLLRINGYFSRLALYMYQE